MNQVHVRSSQAFHLVDSIIGKTELAKLRRNIFNPSDSIVRQIQNKKVIELAQGLVHSRNKAVRRSVSLEELDEEVFIA